MAAFKASARSLDQGIGAVLNALHDFGLAERHADHLHDRPRPRLPRRQGDAVRPRHRRDAAHARPRRLHRRQGLRRDGEPPRHLPDPLRDRRRRAARLPAGHVAAAARPRRGRTDPRRDLHRGDLPRRLRADCARCAPSAGSTSAASTTTSIRSSPTATTAPARRLLVAAGWADQLVADGAALRPDVLDPNEMRNLAEDPHTPHVLERAAASGSRAWMEETEDPLLDGPGPGAARGRRQRSLADLAERPAAHRQHALAVRLPPGYAGSQSHGSDPSPAIVVLARRARARIVLYGFFVVVATISPGQVAALTAVVCALAALFTIRNVRLAAQLADRGGDPSAAPLAEPDPRAARVLASLSVVRSRAAIVALIAELVAPRGRCRCRCRSRSTRSSAGGEPTASRRSSRANASSLPPRAKQTRAA